MTINDDRLLREVSRRNWVILAVLVLVSLFWQSSRVTLGVLAGGLLAIFAYYWRYRALNRLLEAPSQGAIKGFQFNYIVRLTVLAGLLFLLIAKVRVELAALLVGLSVVVLNILITTLQRLIRF